MDSKEAIRQQFMKEYAKKDFSAITVKELCAMTPVARTTFYSYYNNTDDVKGEIEDRLVADLVSISEQVSGGNLKTMDFNRFMNAVEEYIKAHWTEISLFLVQQPNLRFIRKWKDAIKRNFFRRNPQFRDKKNADAVAEIAASSMISAYTYWMEHPEEARPEDVKPLVLKVLSALTEE